MTTNTIKAEIQDVNQVVGYLAMADQDFIVSPMYAQNGTTFKDIVWFSEDNGELCKQITEAVGGRYTHTMDGVEVA